MKNCAVSFVLFVLVLFGGWNVETVHAQELFSETSVSCFSEEEAQAYRNRYMECGNQNLKGKKLIAEEIGETGAERMCQEKGWTPLLKKINKGENHPQGFDQVWRSNDGRIHVIEAKGISKGETIDLSKNRFYHQQGTPEWAIDAAMDTLNSSAASDAEKRVARQVLEAAAKGEMNIDVIVTRHLDGWPEMPGWKSMSKCTWEAENLAKSALESLRGYTVPKYASSTPHTSYSTDLSVPKYTSSTPHTSYNTDLSVPKYTSSTPHTTSGYGAAKSAAQTAAKTGEAASQTGQVVRTVAEGAAVVGVAADVGYRGYVAYQTEQMYQNGQISNHDRVKSHVQNGAGWAGGMTGAVVGAETGAATGAAIGSVVPLVGTAIGGAVGGICGGIGGYFLGDKAASAGAGAAVDACYK